MNKKASVIVVVIVLVVIILFGVGEFFANPAQNAQNNSGASSTAASSAAPVTQVVQYVPSMPASSTATMQGSCWTNSIAAPFRTDAWRCSVGNAIYDPCFEIPGGDNLLCAMNPANPDATSTFALALTAPLPSAQTPQGSVPPAWAWLVKLSDGTLCTPFTGTLPFTKDGITANYGCAPKTAGGEGLYIFGDLNAGTSLWTANVGMLSVSTSSLPTIASSTTVSVAAVWQ